MGDFTPGSIVAGTSRYIASALRFSLPWMAPIVLAAGGAAAWNYARHADPQRLLREKAVDMDAPPLPALSADGRYSATSRWRGDTRDIVVTERATGLERIVRREGTDEHSPSFEGNLLLFRSDKDAMVPGRGGSYDTYAVRFVDGGAEERRTFRGPRKNGAYSLRDVGAAIALPLAAFAGVGAAYLAVFGFIDRRRRREGMRPYALPSLVYPCAVLMAGTEEAKARLDLSRFRQAAAFLRPDREMIRAGTALPRYLEMLSALGDDFPYNALPPMAIGAGWEYTRRHDEYVEDIDDTERDLASAAFAASHYRFDDAAAALERAIATRPNDKALRLFAAEAYAAMDRCDDHRTLTRYVLGAGQRGPDRESAHSRHREHMRALVALVGLDAASFASVPGCKNKVFFPRGELGGVLVFKAGGQELQREYAIGRRLCAINRYGTVPFPVSLDTDTALDDPFLLALRRIDGAPIAGVSGQRWAEIVGRDIARFQRQSSYARLDVPAYDISRRIEDRIAPRLQSIGVMVPGSYREALQALCSCPTMVVHGDCTGDNVLLAEHPVLGRSIAFVDVESVCTAPGALDIGCLLAHFKTEVDEGALVRAYCRSMGWGHRESGSWVAAATMHQWVRQASTLIEWSVKGKISQEEARGRAVAYGGRLERLLSGGIVPVSQSSFLGDVQKGLLRI